MKIHFQKGFTLIELLVVISIISLLSSIVLTSVNSARAKARDARRLIDKEQIIKALQLAYDANQDWPMSPCDGGCWACLGMSDGESCGRPMLGSTSLNNALLPYLSVIPTPDTGGDFPAFYLYGSRLSNWTDTNGVHPAGAYLLWIQEVDMPDQKCPPLSRYSGGKYWQCYQFLGA